METDNKLPLFEHFRLEIGKEQKPVRIDQYIVSKIKYATRNKVQNAIKNRTVLVNNLPIKVHYFLKPDDIITIYFSKPPNEKKIEAQNLPLNIIYEDDYLIVLNKPSGILVHPSISVYQNTLLNGLLYHFQNCKSTDLLENPGIVHRLDKNTSGLMIIAKNQLALKSLGEAFYQHTIKRKYVALVHGEITETSGTINANIDNVSFSKKAIISRNGKRSITHYKVLKKNKLLSLVECELETGRTHQIRLHFEHIGYPLFNDPVYMGSKKYILSEQIKEIISNSKIDGQLLHSYYMKFFHPGLNKSLEFQTDVPKVFLEIFDLFI